MTRINKNFLSGQALQVRKGLQFDRKLSFFLFESKEIGRKPGHL